jgi:hypothetical protein
MLAEYMANLEAEQSGETKPDAAADMPQEAGMHGTADIS